VRIVPDEKGRMTVSEAGRKGGETTSKKYGREFYEEIGEKGGKIGGLKGGETTKKSTVMSSTKKSGTRAVKR